MSALVCVCTCASHLNFEFFILEILVKNYKARVEEPFADTVVRKKFVLVFSGVLAKYHSLTQ